LNWEAAHTSFVYGPDFVLGTNNLTFSYTVQPGDNVSDLQVIGVHLNGDTIFGLVHGDLGIQIDTTPPVPFMSDVISDSKSNLSTISGISEPNSAVSVLDGGKLLGTVTADSSGNWSLQSNITGKVHNFTEVATDLAGNTGSSAGVTVYTPSANKTVAGGAGNDFLIGSERYFNWRRGKRYFCVQRKLWGECHY
jgi:hypothetical protein